MVNFSSLMGFLTSYDLTDVILPFFLYFTILFAILQKTKILGKEKKQFNVIIALVVSLSVVIPHISGNYPNGFDVVTITNTFLPQVSLIAVVLVMMLVLIGVFAPANSGIIAGLGALIVLFLFLGTTEYLYGLSWVYELFGDETISMIVILLVFGLIIWFITSDSGPSTSGGGFMKEFGKLFDK